MSAVNVSNLAASVQARLQNHARATKRRRAMRSSSYLAEPTAATAFSSAASVFANTRTSSVDFQTVSSSLCHTLSFLSEGFSISGNPSFFAPSAAETLLGSIL